MIDTPKEAATGAKAAQDLMLSELLQVCTPAPWLAEGRTVYALEHYSWKKGVEQFCNRFTAAISRGQSNSDGECEANTKLIALAPTIAVELIKERALNAKLLEALKEIDERLKKCFNGSIYTYEAYDSFYQDVVQSAIKQAGEL